MRNMFPGYCYKCGRYVPTGYGFFEKVPRKLRAGRAKWRVQCVECADGRKVAESDEAVISTRNRRDKWLKTNGGAE